MLSWAKQAIEELSRGKEVKIENEVSFIRGKLRQGSFVTLEAMNGHKPEPGTIVLVRLNGKDYLREIEDMGKKKVLVGETSGVSGGWVRKRDIYGIVKKIEKN